MSILPCPNFLPKLLKIHGWYYPIALWLTQRKGFFFFSHLHRGAIWASCGPECNLWICDRCSSESCWKCYWSIKEKATEWCLISQKKVRIPGRRNKTPGYLVFCVLQKAFLHWAECGRHWLLQSKPRQWVEISLRTQLQQCNSYLINKTGSEAELLLPYRLVNQTLYCDTDNIWRNKIINSESFWKVKGAYNIFSSLSLFFHFLEKQTFWLVRNLLESYHMILWSVF